MENRLLNLDYALNYLCSCQNFWNTFENYFGKYFRSLSDIVKHYRCGSLDQDIFETGKSSKSLNYSVEDDQRSKQVDFKNICII